SPLRGGGSPQAFPPFAGRVTWPIRRLGAGGTCRQRGGADGVSGGRDARREGGTSALDGVLHEAEREARRAGRWATVSGAAAGSAGAIGAVALSGTVGRLHRS